MSRINRPVTVLRSRVALSLVAVAAMLVAGGCDELSSRRKIQEGNKLYGAAKYAEASEAYEQALAKTDLPIAHFNAGIAYYRQFQAGNESPENIAIARKATEHFAAYLETDPRNARITDLLTNIYLDAGLYEEAIAWWKNEHDKAPSDPEPISHIHTVYRQAGDYWKAVEWMRKQVEVVDQTDAKVKILADIGVLSNAYRKDKSPAERLVIIDTGIAALQEAEAMDPDDADVQNYLTILYDKRSLTHGPSWAFVLDQASVLQHRTRFRKLDAERKAREEADAAKKAAAPAADGAETAAAKNDG